MVKKDKDRQVKETMDKFEKLKIEADIKIVSSTFVLEILSTKRIVYWYWYGLLGRQSERIVYIWRYRLCGLGDCTIYVVLSLGRVE